MRISLKRVYAAPSPDDGTRILVDRLWPRGLTKEKARVDIWMKDVAPSTELRKWFGHDPERWAEFTKRYLVELRAQAALVDEIRRQARHGPVTLLYAAKDETHNEAIVIQRVLQGRKQDRKSVV